MNLILGALKGLLLKGILIPLEDKLREANLPTIVVIIVLVLS